MYIISAQKWKIISVQCFITAIVYPLQYNVGNMIAWNCGTDYYMNMISCGFFRKPSNN